LVDRSNRDRQETDSSLKLEDILEEKDQLVSAPCDGVDYTIDFVYLLLLASMTRPYRSPAISLSISMISSTKESTVKAPDGTDNHQEP